MNNEVSYLRIIVYLFLGFVVGYFISIGLFWLGSQDINFNPVLGYFLSFLMISMPFILAILGGFIGFKIKKPFRRS